MDDIFYTTRWKTKIFIPENNLDVRLNYDWHNQFVWLSNAVNFGNAKSKSVNSKTAADEERKRIAN